ncbi:MAG: hypothetical protein IPK10_14855 [Bacteroidetes bacterium]|nr:hypothetical protein [Bacteroidota bacterium]
MRELAIGIIRFKQSFLGNADDADYYDFHGYDYSNFKLIYLEVFSVTSVKNLVFFVVKENRYENNNFN